MRYAVVDLETTGSKAHLNRIIEIGIVIIENGKILQKFESLVDGKQEIPIFIQNLTGISPGMLIEAPTFDKIAQKVHSLLKDCIFVAHNASFDYVFLKAEFKRAGIEWSSDRLCTLKVSRKAFPGLASYSLKQLVKSLNCSDFRHHRALGDAIAASEVLLLTLEKWGEPQTLKHLNRVRLSKLPVYT